MEKGKVSVLINCYNNEKYLGDAIDSVFAQTYSNWEIIFVDNCSTDKSAKIAKAYGSKIKYIKTPELIPLYAARNYGLEKASGEYLAILDSDDEWLPFKLENQVKAAQESDSIIIYTGFGHMFEGYSKLRKFATSLLRKLENQMGRLFHKGQVNINTLLQKYDICLQSVLIKREKTSHYKFNDKLQLPGDYDYLMKIILENKNEPYFIPTAHCNVRLHSNQLSRFSSLRWVTELTYVYLFSLRKFMSHEQKEICKRSINRFKSQHELSKGNKRKAIKYMEPIRFSSIHNFVFYLRLLFSRVQKR